MAISSGTRVVRIALLATAVVSAGAGLVALQPADWPQFRGPDGQGHADVRDVPVSWSEATNVAWKVPVPGRGWSSPVTGHGMVWLTTATSGRDGAFRLLAYDMASGQERLNVEIARGADRPLLNAKNSHASPTPIIDGDRVYVHFGEFGTAAVQIDGRILWASKQRCETQHGSGGSPVLHAGLLILACDGFDAAYVVALDAASGKARWKTWRKQPWSQAYSTPLVIEQGGAAQLVSVGAHHAVSYDPLTGKELWRVSYGDGFSNVPRPLFGNGLVYMTTGFQQPSLLAVRPDGKGDVTRSHVAWRVARGVPHTPSPVLDGKELYMVSDAGVLTCLDATTGEVIYQQRLDGTFSASPILAAGRLYLPGEDGITRVVRPGRTFELLAANALDAPILASMAVDAQSFFIRTATHLYRISASAKQNGWPQVRQTYSE